MMFDIIPVEHVDFFWPEVKEILKPSFRYIRNSHQVDDYLAPLKAGNLQMWLAKDGDKVVGACVTAIDHEYTGKVLFIYSVAGERLKDWVHLMDAALDQFGLANGCHCIEAVTRKGFSKLVPAYKEDGVIYVKMLGAHNG